jgi:hypothetical protein
LLSPKENKGYSPVSASVECCHGDDALSKTVYQLHIANLAKPKRKQGTTYQCQSASVACCHAGLEMNPWSHLFCKEEKLQEKKKKKKKKRTTRWRRRDSSTSSSPTTALFLDN